MLAPTRSHSHRPCTLRGDVRLGRKGSGRLPLLRRSPGQRGGPCAGAAVATSLEVRVRAHTPSAQRDEARVEVPAAECLCPSRRRRCGLGAGARAGSASLASSRCRGGGGFKRHGCGRADVGNVCARWRSDVCPLRPGDGATVGVAEDGGCALLGVLLGDGVLGMGGT